MYRPEPREKKSSLEQMMSKFISSTETRLQNQDASIKGLENHIGQLAKMIDSRDPGTLPSNTETNLKEQVKDIALRNGKVLEQEGKEKGEQKEEATETSTRKSSNFTPAPTTKSRIVIPPPFPAALKKTKMDAQFGKFLEVFKKLYINIPFTNALMQMPSYAKFLKGILANKRKLELGEPKPKRMSLQLEDRSDAMKDQAEATLTTELKEDDLDEEKSEIVVYFNVNHPCRKSIRKRLEDLGDRRDLTLPKSSIKEPPTLELKPLPPHIKYVYIGDNNNLPVIISVVLTDAMEGKLLQVLKEHKKAFSWKVAYIKGISPSICMHKILMEEKYSPLMQPKRRLNPKIQEVVKAETIKLLDAGIIYSISNSVWVSLVQCVPKKGRITLISSENNELIPTGTVTGWRVCIDYRKFNDATRKDHFPLPIIDQMLERLEGHKFYSFLDGYSGYNQIIITPENREKTTFICPYGTFAFQSMPFGICNVTATFK
ncbi:uncharacterized protein [Primulina huaijiensis]|uniref:uncharacterized protein n=1 Tax=Primulina huaijiensis TaxID=1492673 RepID=UPI003CC75D2B